MTEHNNSLDYKVGGRSPKIAIVLGSGLGPLAESLEDPREIPYSEIPGFPVSTVEGHDGKLCFGLLSGIPVVCMKGRVHYYEGYSMRDVTFPVRFLHGIGVEQILLTNAAGGIRAGFIPGTLMVIEDHISSYVPSPFIGLSAEEYGGTRFVDMTKVYETKILLRAAEEEKIAVEKGVYLQTTGPEYETPAEVRMFRALGADVVGMSTTVEAAMANALGMKVHGLSCVTNLAAGLGDGTLSHEEVKAAADQASEKLVRLVKRFISLIGDDNEDLGEEHDKGAVTEPHEVTEKNLQLAETKPSSASETITKKEITLFTDGAARSNPDGPGGYGAVLIYTDSTGKEHTMETSQGFEKTTNNRMEMMAVIEGLSLLTEPCKVTVHSDSQYVINAFNKGWLKKWIAAGWKRGKDPVKNVDLWKRMLKVMESHDVTFVWVRGHAGNPMNERCDELATTAADNGPWLVDEVYINGQS